MRTNNVPSMVMLSAGVVYCVFATQKQLEAMAFIKQLLIVLIIFFFIGVILRVILDKAMAAFADKQPETKKEDQDSNSTQDESKVEEKK